MVYVIKTLENFLKSPKPTHKINKINHHQLNLELAKTVFSLTDPINFNI